MRKKKTQAIDSKAGPSANWKHFFFFHYTRCCLFICAPDDKSESKKKTADIQVHEIHSQRNEDASDSGADPRRTVRVY